MGSLRRSCRKRRVSSSCSAFCTPPPSEKKRRRVKRSFASPAVTPKLPPLVISLDKLPRPVLARLLGFLQVDSLENLAATCSTFDQMINCRFLSSLDFPFHSSFLRELEKTDLLEKKHLLKLRCKKTRQAVCPTAQHDWEEDQTMHWLMLETTTSLSRYMMRSQLSLLSLSFLRELDLVPESFRDTWGVRRLDQVEVELYLNFDKMLVLELQKQGHLAHLTRLGVMQDHHMYLQDHVATLNSLIELNISILTRINLKKRDFDLYLMGLQSVVSGCKAKILNIEVIAETRRKDIKNLVSHNVEKLSVTGPCSFNMMPAMSKLREVDVKFTPVSPGDSSCSYWRSPADDRSLHRAGMCCVNFSSVYRSCPSLEKFCNMSLPSRSLSPTKWCQEVKRKFYSGYVGEGGTLELSKWSKRRWFRRQTLVHSQHTD